MFSFFQWFNKKFTRPPAWDISCKMVKPVSTDRHGLTKGVFKKCFFVIRKLLSIDTCPTYKEIIFCRKTKVKHIFIGHYIFKNFMIKTFGIICLRTLQ